MAEVVPFRQTPTTDEYFGGCPHCGHNDGHVNNGPDHWFICYQHKTKWLAGSNLFSGWRDEDEEMWKLNRFRLSGYMIAKPIYPDPIIAERGHRLSRRLNDGHG